MNTQSEASIVLLFRAKDQLGGWMEHDHSTKTPWADIVADPAFETRELLDPQPKAKTP
jgi:hypothetical protein